MRFLIMLLLLSVAMPDGDTDYSRLNDLQREGLKGNVRSEETTEGNKATYSQDKWNITLPGTVTKIRTYNKQGYLAATDEMLQGKSTIAAQYWKDEDGLPNALATDKENDNKNELVVHEFANDSTLVIKTYTTDEDTIAYEQLEEEVRTYTGFGYRREHFSVKNGNKRRYLYYEKRTLSPDTFSLNYYGDNATRFTNVILERDGMGNPTKILVYTEEDTTLTVKKYSYY